MSRLAWKLSVVVLIWSHSCIAHAGGWYHMPTSFCQCMGWGFGPGYHAPLLLGPHGCVPTRPQRVVHLPAAPCGVGVGCDGCDLCGMSQLAEPAYMPAEFGEFESIEGRQLELPPPPTTELPTGPPGGPATSSLHGRQLLFPLR